MSCFGGWGKKTAWDTWKSDDGVSAAYCAMTATPNPTTVDECLGPLERFVVLLCDHTSGQQKHVNSSLRPHHFQLLNGVAVSCETNPFNSALRFLP